jgi:glycosyltransferase involved in cell wall biosynthesis
VRIACANWSRRRAGGVESYLEFLIPELVARGHEVGFWSETDDPADRARLAFQAVSTWNATEDGVDESLRALAAWRPSVMFTHGLVDPRLEARLLEIAPAVVLAHSFYGTCISGGKTMMFPTPRPCERTFGPACLGLFYPRRCGGLSPVTMWREYRHQSDRLDVVRRHRAVLTLSEYMRAEYVRHGWDSTRVRHLPPYLPSVQIVSAQPGNGDVRVLFAGRLDRLKGCALLIDAMPSVAARAGRLARLVIAGDGPERAGLEAAASRVAKAGRVRVRFEGWVDSSKRAALLADTDVAAMPSLWPEPYGLAGLESIVAGVPVAAFRSGGVPEWLDDGVTGALAPADPPTAEGLADAIGRCLQVGRFAPKPSEELRATRHAHIDAVIAALESAGGADARNARA